MPESELEQAEIVFDGEDWLRQDYLGQPIAMLEEYANEHYDHKAWAALVILRAQAQAE